VAQDLRVSIVFVADGQTLGKDLTETVRVARQRATVSPKPAMSSTLSGDAKRAQDDTAVVVIGTKAPQTVNARRCGNYAALPIGRLGDTRG